MKTGVFLNYIGLGANLMHLAYCHKIASIHGPITLISLAKNLDQALEDDPLIEQVIIFDKNKRYICALHSGWKGALKNIAAKGIEYFVKQKIIKKNEMMNKQLSNLSNKILKRLIKQARISQIQKIN